MSLALPRLRAQVREHTATRRRSWLDELLPVLGLSLVTALVFWNDLFRGQAYYGPDTISFYYPLTSWYAGQLKAGQLPLWFPYIFGGYPLFADGEVGMLYPLHLLLYWLLPTDSAFVLLRVLHFWLAGLFTYWFARLLGQARFGALLSALAFSYCGFLVGHLQHDNIIRTTIWLPLALGLLELGLRSSGRRRLTWLLCCSLVVATQALAVHVQPLLISLLALAALGLVGPLGRGSAPAANPCSGWREHLHSIDPRRLVRHVFGRLCLVTTVAGAGLALAAVQLLPLYQLAERSVRADQLNYEFATSYSIPPVQLLQVVLPYLFRPDRSGYWGLWSAAETTLYLGVAPLLLALVALAYLRGRAIGFCGALGLAGFLLALGDYAPLHLYALVWWLPGFSAMRVPARLGLLTLFSGALLAGFASDWLSSRLFDRQPPPRPRLRSRRLLLICLASTCAALLMAVAFAALRAWADLDPDGLRRGIETSYLSLRHGDPGLSASTVSLGLRKSFDLANPRTVGGLCALVLSALLLLSRGVFHMSRALWQLALLTLVVLDLVIFAEGFYPEKSVGNLRLSLPSVQFLADHNGLHRTFVEPQLYGMLGPNQLVLSNLDFAGGYSSLEPRRASEYWWSIVRQDNILMDLFNVRFIVAPRVNPGLMSYEGGLFHPNDRLMRGSADNPSGIEAFQFSPWWVQSISIVASLDDARNLPFGEPVADIAILGDNREEHLKLRAGLDVEDSGVPLVGPRLPGAANGPRIVWTGPSMQQPNKLAVLYGAVLQLERPMMATSLTVTRVGSGGALNVHGLGLHDRPGLPVRSLMPTDRAKYRLEYQDLDVSIYENTAALPRAWVVRSARTPSRGTEGIVDEMLTGPFDPRTTILVDGAPSTLPTVTSAQGLNGSASVVDYATDRVAVKAEVAQDGYLVLADRYEDGWHARVDGREASLLRADGLFRAVPISAGLHEVVFTYEPLAFRLGALISVVALVAVASLLAWRLLKGRVDAVGGVGVGVGR